MFQYEDQMVVGFHEFQYYIQKNINIGELQKEYPEEDDKKNLKKKPSKILSGNKYQ